ncbi:MAG: hypothetical protein J6H31_12820 [Butyrivibrio sp.]|nr:hypothetical protein [Butyrivibrio sp.]
MAKRNIFTIEELRLVTDAFYHSELNHDSDWVKYLLSNPQGSDAYDKYFFNLTERTQDYFEEMADVAVKDCWSYYERLKDAGLAEDEKKALNSEINGWIEAAFEEFLI